MSELKVCIDARVTPGSSGGAAQTVLGLAAGLAQLARGPEHYLFLTYRDVASWLRPYLGENSSMLFTLRTAESSHTRRNWLREHAERHLPAPLEWWRRLPLRSSPSGLPPSDGLVERSGAQVMHFTLQGAFRTSLPNLYSPLDLQHLHLPDFFPPRIRALREHTYRAACEQADRVIAMSTWGRADLIRAYGLPQDKVVVIPAASILAFYPHPSQADLDDVRQRMRLPSRFAFYPANTWEHKNHIGLLEAIAMLRDQRGLEIPIVATGQHTSFFRHIRARVHALRLDGQVLFPGYVTPLELNALYALSDMVVVPTMFEGWGLPISEAHSANKPLVCSAIEPLLQLAGDAAEFVNPLEPADIARGLARVWNDQARRAQLVRQGAERSTHFSWERTAALCRAHYRSLVGVSLSADDRALLARPPLV